MYHYYPFHSNPLFEMFLCYITSHLNIACNRKHTGTTWMLMKTMLETAAFSLHDFTIIPNGFSNFRKIIHKIAAVMTSGATISFGWWWTKISDRCCNFVRLFTKLSHLCNFVRLFTKLPQLWQVVLNEYSGTVLRLYCTYCGTVYWLLWRGSRIAVIMQRR